MHVQFQLLVQFFMVNLHAVLCTDIDSKFSINVDLLVMLNSVHGNDNTEL